jgi:ribosomal protein S6
MKHYEAAFIITPELSEDEAKEKMNEVIAKVQEIGGNLEDSLTQRSPIKRRLSYAINKKEIAYLGSVYFTLEKAQDIKDIKEFLDKDNTVLRSLIVVHKEQKKEEIPHLHNKEDKAPKLAEASEEETEEEEIKEDKKENSKVELQEVDEKLDEILE